MFNFFRKATYNQISNDAILIGAVLVIANPGAGIAVARYFMILLGAGLIVFGSVRCLIKSSIFRKKFSYLLVFCLIVEIFVLFNQIGAFSLRGVLFRFLCYVFLIGGSASGYLVDKMGRVTTSLCPRILVSLTGISALLYLISYRVVQGSAAVGRGAASEDFNPVGIAFNYGLLFVVNSLIFLKSRELNVRLIGCFSAVFCLASVVTTASRGGLLFMVVTVFIAVALFLFRANMRRKMRLLVSVLFLFIGGGALALSQVDESQIDFIVSRFSGAATNTKYDPSLVERADVRSYYFNQIDRWFLFGLRGYNPESYPHNFFLELWIRFGFFGNLCWIACLILGLSGFRILWYCWDDLSICLILFPGIFNFLNAQTSLSLEFNRWLFLALGFVFGFGLKRRDLFMFINKRNNYGSK